MQTVVVRCTLLALATLLFVASPLAVAQSEAPVDGQADAGQAQSNQAQAKQALVKQAPVVGWLELSGPLRDGPVPYAWVSDSDAQPSLRDVIHGLERVASHEQYAGIVLFLDRPQLTLTQATAIGDAINRARAAGKKVFTFAEQYDMLTYVLASSADQILLQNHGRVHLSGLAVEELYVAGLLNKIGVKADLMQVGRFKGAEDPFTRTEPSEAWSENIDSLLDDLYDQVLTRIADGRGMTREQVEQLMADAWTMSDRDYLRRRVVDRLTDRDLSDVVQQTFGENFTWDQTLGGGQAQQQVQNPFALFRTLFQEPQMRVDRPSLAVLHATGPVVSGESSRGGGLFASNTIGSKTMIKMLARVRENPMIKGVVVRIDSPGGSALASEVIWQAMRRTAEQKPVIVSIGRLAASGGYYIASAGDQIYVSPQSIVGSIGVVGGKVVLGDLYEKLDIHVHRRNRGPMAGMFNSVEPFNDEQRAALREGLERVYAQFLDRVKIGRGDRIEQIEQLAKGRVFSGRQTVDNGLSDKLGGLDAALAGLAERADLEAGEYEVVHLPPPMSLGEFFNDMFGTGNAQVAAATNPWLETARHALGPKSWQASRRVLTGLMLLREEPALTLMPYVLMAR